MRYHYYILTTLPTLGEFDSTAPLTLRQLLEYVADIAAPKTLLEAVFLSDDLLQWQSCLAGETTDPDTVVLTPGQSRNEEPLPDYLFAGTIEGPTHIPGDELWATYFRHAAAVADRLGSKFLTAWVEYEVTLRNAVASARAKALNLDPTDYLVATELAVSDADLSPTLNEWSGSENPFVGLGILDKARWDWLVQHDGWFTFDNDELASYAAKLMLLCRRQRLGQTQQERRAPQSANTNLKPERTNV